jgi:hypothetical protein
MLLRELVQRYASPGGTAWWTGADDEAPGQPAEAERLEPGTALTADDVVLLQVPEGPGLSALVPPALPVGCHLVLLVEGGAGGLPARRLLDVLGAARVQVVDAAPVAAYGEAVTAVVGVRTDVLSAPHPRLADTVGDPSPSDDAWLGRLLGEAVLGRLVWPARERVLTLELETAQAQLASGELEAARRDLEAARRDLERTRAELSRLRGSRSYRIARRLAGGARRLRHPLRGAG